MDEGHKFGAEEIYSNKLEVENRQLIGELIASGVREEALKTRVKELEFNIMALKVSIIEMEKVLNPEIELDENDY